MSPSYELLEWDSAFFGFPVARISADTGDEAELRAALGTLRNRSVRLAYWLPPDDGKHAMLARRLGAAVVGAHICYERALDAAGASRGAIGIESAQAHPEGLSELVRLGIEAARWSRFALDPHMPDGTAERMYRIWVERSVLREIADEVLLARGDAHGVSGMITLACRADTGIIGLIAVDPQCRRRHVGRRLLESASDWFARRGLRRACVTTQASNVAACRLYESCGYVVSRRLLVAHFWL